MALSLSLRTRPTQQRGEDRGRTAHGTWPYASFSLEYSVGLIGHLRTAASAPLDEATERRSATITVTSVMMPCRPAALRGPAAPLTQQAQHRRWVSGADGSCCYALLVEGIGVLGLLAARGRTWSTLPL
jgi:hypothetical protein